MADDRTSLDFLSDIPDPAAHLAARAAPEIAAPPEPSPTRPARERSQRVAVAAACAWVLAAAFLAGIRDDIGSAAVAATLGLWSLLAGAGLLLALRPNARGLPASVRTVQAIVAAVPVGFLAMAIATSIGGVGALAGQRDAPCAFIGTSAALAPLALAAFALRRSFLSAPAWRGAAIGVVCGLAGTVGIHAHCRLGELVHVAIAHGAPIALGALLGAAAGAWHGRA